MFVSFALASESQINNTTSPFNPGTNPPYPYHSNPYSYESLANRNFEGVTLNILVHEKPNMGEPVERHARQFEQLTGAKLILHHVPFGELYPRVLWGLRNHWYDIIFFGSLWLPDTAPYLLPMPDKMLNSAQHKDIIPYHQQIAIWEGKVLQVPIDGDRHFFQYRLDVFQDSKLKALYQQRFGIPLLVPRTWKEVNQVASFFHGKTLVSGEQINGLVEITKKDDLMFSNYIKRAAPYAKHPAVKGGFYFDLETMEPLINTPGFVEALKDFTESQHFYPPGGNEFGLADVNQSFGKGSSVFTDSWDDSFIYAMEKNSPIHNKVSALISPGSREVWNRKTQQWDYFPAINYAPYIAWGWTSAVASSTAYPEASFDFLGFFGNTRNHNSDLLIGRFGVNPFRNSDLNTDFWIKGADWKPEITRAYIATFEQQKAIKNRVFDLRIISAGLYMKALSIGVKRALMGKSSAQQALDDVAHKWRKLNETIGIEKQRRAYRNVVRLEDSIQ
ncbi:ABC transporter substrate-binding protein [Motiliproteus sp. MSK22-1]|uniref:ABC transporter substrate-binding protein n=1 Tax=Motiliproteus sp. MSK22-1 TaxID=1897630 RepID=UPI001300F589|nr:extracellular solute-binding protein [Motiliproteus sp. MSK22-1]